MCTYILNFYASAKSCMLIFDYFIRVFFESHSETVHADSKLTSA